MLNHIYCACVISRLTRCFPPIAQSNWRRSRAAWTSSTARCRSPRRPSRGWSSAAESSPSSGKSKNCPATLLEKFWRISLYCVWLMTLLQSSMWHNVSSNRGKRPNIYLRRAKPESHQLNYLTVYLIFLIIKCERNCSGNALQFSLLIHKQGEPEPIVGCLGVRISMSRKCFVF